MPAKQITPAEAKELLDVEDGYIYLDIRSEYEFRQGHPESAYNIPLQQVDEASRMMVGNPEFLAVVEMSFPKDAKLLIGCAAGPRSQFACQLLENAGYENLCDVRGGFSGLRDMFGNVIQEGWAGLGLPVGNGDGGEKGYRALREKEG